MEALGTVLPIVIYFLLIILLVIIIILGIKFIITVDRINQLVDEVNDKLSSLKSIFGLINTVTNKMNFLGNAVKDKVKGILNKFIGIGSERDDEDEW